MRTMARATNSRSWIEVPTSEGKSLRKQIAELTERLRRAEHRIELLEHEARRLRQSVKPTDAVGSELGVAEIAEIMRRHFPQGYSRNG